MKLDDLRTRMRHKHLIIRNMTNLLESQRFIFVYDTVNDVQKKQLADAVLAIDSEVVETLLRKFVRKDITLMNITELRYIGQVMGIANYHILPKTSLLSAIRNREIINGRSAIETIGLYGKSVDPSESQTKENPKSTAEVLDALRLLRSTVAGQDDGIRDWTI